MAAAFTDESYDRLFIVATHSEVIYPKERIPLPENMTVATLTKLNQTIHVKDGQIPTDMFRPMFSQFGSSKDYRGIAHHVLPTDSKIMALLSELSAKGIVYATHNGRRYRCDFRQRKNQEVMTVQMCFLPGGLVHSGIYEFSQRYETGTDVSDVILGPKDNPGMQLYRETNDKDRTIIETEKRLMADFKTTDCPPDVLIIARSGGTISQEDINQLRENRERYKSAIQFGDSINEFCSHVIEDVEMLRTKILQLVIHHDTPIQDHLKWVNIYHIDQPSSDETLKQVILALKRSAMSDRTIIPVGNLARVLIHNVLASIYRSKLYSDYKSVTTGHTPIRSDDLFERIFKYSGDDKVYVVFIGCRHVPSPNPADLVVEHSPKGSNAMDFNGGRKVRRRSVNKPKTRKMSKRIHKKLITNRSQHRSYRR
jgi:hypothetical protein